MTRGTSSTEPSAASSVPASTPALSASARTPRSQAANLGSAVSASAGSGKSAAAANNNLRRIMGAAEAK